MKDGKDQTQPAHPITLLSTHAAPSQTHTHLTLLHQLLSSHTPLSYIARQLRYTQCLNHVYQPHVLHSPQPHLIYPHTSIAVTLALSQLTHMQHKQLHALQSHQPHPHRVPRQPHRHTKDDHMTTNTTTQQLK